MSERISRIFAIILNYTLPNARWLYHGVCYENDDAAKWLMPLFLRQSIVWLGEQDSRIWGFGTSILFIKDKNAISGFICRISENVIITPVLLFALETAIFAQEIAKVEANQEIDLDFLDNPISLMARFKLQS